MAPASRMAANALVFAIFFIPVPSIATLAFRSSEAEWTCAAPAPDPEPTPILGPGLGLTADDVPDLGPLLLGPMARGAEVTLR